MQPPGPPPRLQYTVSFVRFFTHFELHILLVDTVTFNPNLWFVGELLVEDFSRVWMDARFSGKLSLHHAATYIVFGYPIPSYFSEKNFRSKEDSIKRKCLLLKLEIKSFVSINEFHVPIYIYIETNIFNIFFSL